MSRDGPRAFRCGDYVLEASEHRLLRGSQEIPLRPKVFQLLLLLVENQGHLREYVRPYSLAKIHAGLEERDLAFQYLEKAFEERDVSLAFVLTDETLMNLHADPRFAELVAKMGLASNLATAGCCIV